MSGDWFALPFIIALFLILEHSRDTVRLIAWMVALASDRVRFI